MTIYTCSRKRMVVNKFSNRPPFELKPNESSVTSKNSEKFKKSLESINKSYNSIIKQLDNIEINQRKSSEINTTNKNIIPKIIESFQKITPKREVIIVRNRNYLSSQDSSVQTIFRNKNSNFGKHIPNHRIMKNLLKNFGSGTKMYIENDQVDTIPTRDTECLKKRRENYAKIKVDKTTSTSGIVWPVFLKNPQICDDHPSVKIRNNQSQIPHHFSNKTEYKTIDKTKSKIPKRKIAMKAEIVRRVQKEENRSNDLELNPSNEDISKKSLERISRCHVRTREHTYIIEEENAEEKNGTVKELIKENSFVQTQVEKFNKMGNKKQGRKKTTKAPDFQKRNWNLNRNYLGMMTSARTGFPKIEERLLEHTTTDNYDWSDIGDNKPEVKFPKETRHAMETIIQSASRTPLSKYLRHRDLDVQPAIPVYQGHQGGQRGPSYMKKVARDRGDFEGLTANLMEKVSPCRCSDRPMKKHRSRRIPIKCKQ